MKKLIPQIILLFYDYPQVFIGKNEVDTLFICMVTSEADSGQIYTCTPISIARKNQLVSGLLDLRTVFSKPEVQEFYQAEPNTAANDFMLLTALPEIAMPINLLPAEGLYFDALDEVALKAAELNTTVSYVSLGVPEAHENVRIKSTTLAEFLNVYQNALKNLTKLTAKEMNKPLKRNDDPFCTDVFGFSMGSFTIHLRSSAESDLLGNNYLLAMSLEKMNNFLTLVDDPDQAILYLQSIKGRTASSLIKLLAFLTEKSCTIKHRWANPEMMVSAKSEVTLGKIKGLATLCKRRNDLLIEDVTITGIVSAANKDTNTWKIISDEDQITYSGAVHEDADVTLSGITIGSVRYKFHCEELSENITATGKEVSNLFLKKIDVLQA